MYYLRVQRCIKSVPYTVYIIVWVAIVFGIYSLSNAGRKIVIVRGTAEHYYNFLLVFQIPNTIQQPILLQITPI